MSTFETDFKKSQEYLPLDIEIALKYYPDADTARWATDDEDLHEATDVVVYTKCGLTKRIAVRGREYAAAGYRDQFTIRSSRPSGALTELAKIQLGYGDAFLYVHRYGDVSWFLGDLDVFRSFLNTGGRPVETKFNHDGSSDFNAYRIRDIGMGFVIAQKGLGLDDLVLTRENIGAHV